MKTLNLKTKTLNFTTSSKVQTTFPARDYILGNPDFKLSPQ